MKKLITVRVPEAQAEVQAEAIADLVNEQLATKRDIEELRIATKRDLAELEMRLKHDLTLRLGGIVLAGFTVTVGMIGVVIALLAL